MDTKTIYVGVGVDDNEYHASAFDVTTGELLDYRCRPTLQGMLKMLGQIQSYFPGSTLKLCYEASYIGFTLQRDLVEHGYHCDVIAPSSIPKPRSKQVKTDRIDAGDLARYHANGLLTVVHPPEMEIEQDRDFMRSRQHVLEQRADTRRHIQSLMRRHGFHYKAETKTKSHWTKHHISWLERTIESLSGSLKDNFELLMRQMKVIDAIIIDYDQRIEELAATPRYETAVQALTCYKGIKHIFALTMITEIGNIDRFSHPRKLASWVGMDIREYSSGGNHRRFGITKHGNRYLRTAFIEANQRGFHTPRISKDLKSRRKNTPLPFIDIADRCLRRLSKKGNRLLNAGKHPNKVKVACAREMIGFVWESLRLAAA